MRKECLLLFKVNQSLVIKTPVTRLPLFENIGTLHLLDLSQVDKKHQRDFSFRPRVLITGTPGQALSTYVGPAILHHLERLPRHILDLPTLYSNSARSPEEKLCHIIHEARRTVPSVLYIPDLAELCMTEAIKMAFLSLLSGIQPTAPLLVSIELIGGEVICVLRLTVPWEFHHLDKQFRLDS